MEEEKKPISNELKELVIARINARMSSNLKLAMGSGGSLDKKDMIQHIMNNDEIGHKIVETHLNFMRAQSSGQLTNALNEIE